MQKVARFLENILKWEQRKQICFELEMKKVATFLENIPCEQRRQIIGQNQGPPRGI